MGRRRNSFGRWLCLCAHAVLASAVFPKCAYGQCTYEEEQELLGTSVLASFGQAIAIDGDRAIIGSTGTAAGAHVWELNDQGVWEEVALLDSSDNDAGLLGHSVAISGNVAVVGSGGGHNLLCRGGVSAYIFVAPDTGWEDMTTHRVKLTLPDVNFRDGFGFSVAINEDRVVVGAPGEDGPGEACDNCAGLCNVSSCDGCDTFNEGAVYIFNTPDGGWDSEPPGTVYSSPNYTLRPFGSTPTTNAEFGLSLSMSGDTILVGAPFEFSAGLPVGSAYVFEYNPNAEPDPQWEPRAELRGSNLGNIGFFGRNVALEGDTAVCGSVFNGSAYVFERDFPATDAWAETAHLISVDETAADFGSSVAIFENTILVGANGSCVECVCGSQGCSTSAYRGAAYVFQRQFAGASHPWRSQARLIASDGEGMDSFGVVAVGPSGILVGAPRHDHDGIDYEEGAAYAFPPFPMVIDCNMNGVDDRCDIRNGTSMDENGNGVPDECETGDCNQNGLPDVLDILVTSEDCDLNLVPDECDCAADVAFCDRAVNVSDMLLIIQEWGPCPIAGPCRADIAPFTPGQGYGDGVVGVSDLNVVLANWGCCTNYDCDPGDHLRMPTWVTDCLSLCGDLDREYPEYPACLLQCLEANQ